jgi:hypothetical protein
MKKSRFLIAVTVLATLMIFYQVYAMPSSNVPVVASRINNPDLKTILPNWQGTPVDKNGRFLNHEFPATQKFGDAVKWTFEKNPQKQTKKNDTWRMQVVTDDNFLNTKEDVVVLLGHSTFFIRLNGKQILIDPICGDLAMHTRYTKFPIEPAKLVNIDYVLISHSHYDHCDKASLEIIQNQNPGAKFLAGLNMKSLLSKWVGNNEVQEAGWYQQYKLDDEIEISFFACQAQFETLC